MILLAATFHVAAAVLAAGGAAKLAWPTGAVGALRSAGLRVSPAVVRALAASELMVGGGALLMGWTVLYAIVGLAFLSFAAFVLHARSRDLALSTCGCLGTADTPPTVAHLVVDLLAAASAFGAFVRQPPRLAEILADQPAGGIPYVALLLLAVWLVVVLLVEVPRSMAWTSAGGPA